ncbi:hypothetical protein N9948_00650 [bacterium]|nr:hypothetical protein [bacterium]
MNGSKMLSEFIEDLQKIHSEHGDMPIASSTNHESITTTGIYTYTTPYYYDGGCIYPELKVDDEKHCTSWRSSKHNKEEFGDRYLVIASDCPNLTEGGDIVNGYKLPEISDEDWEGEDDSILEAKIKDLETKYKKARNEK